MAVAYIDYSAMEFLIAAVLSDGHCGSDNLMLDAYNTGDPDLAFAMRIGVAPRDAADVLVQSSHLGPNAPHASRRGDGLLAHRGRCRLTIVEAPTLRARCTAT
jgi:hypothetical protein